MDAVASGDAGGDVDPSGEDKDECCVDAVASEVEGGDIDPSGATTNLSGAAPNLSGAASNMSGAASDPSGAASNLSGAAPDLSDELGVSNARRFFGVTSSATIISFLRASGFSFTTIGAARTRLRMEMTREI